MLDWKGPELKSLGHGRITRNAINHQCHQPPMDHFALATQILMNMRVSWLLGRLRRLLPLFVLGILVFMFYSMSTRPIAKAIPSLPSPPMPPSLANHWVIVNSSDGGVCSSLASEFFHWTVLLVSVKTIPKRSHSSCIFLSDDDLNFVSERYGIRFLQQMALAYLYAISHGAAVIYTPLYGGDVSLLLRPPLPLLSNRHWGLVYNASTSFDAALHFGCRTGKQWPSTYLMSSNYMAAIHTPAVLDWSLMTKCPTLGPPVVLSKGTYVNMSLEGSTFTREAFWALPVIDFSQAETDRSYWLQMTHWLLWQTGRSVRVYWDDVYQKTLSSRKPSMVSNKDLVLQKCGSTKFQACAISTVTRLFDKMSYKDAMIEWFDALERVGFFFPKLFHSSSSHSSDSMKDSTVWFKPVEFTLPTVLNTRTQKPLLPVANVNRSKNLYDVTCRNQKRLFLPTRQSYTWEVPIDFSRPWYQFHSVLLVITFNVAHYEAIPYLELLYRSFFPNILYCGPELPNLEKYPSLQSYEFSFVTFDHRTKDKIPGSLNYECAIKALYMRYQVDGYLMIADDLLLLINPLTSFPGNVMWHIPESELRIGDLVTLRECRLGMCDFNPHWHWWEDYASVAIKLLQKFKDEQWTSPLIHHCYSELVRLNGAEFRANGGYSDVYYVPSRLAEDFAELAQMFLMEKIFLELTVPTIIRCLELPEDIHSLPGKQVWSEDRDQPWKYFVRSQLYEKTHLHPTKWSGLANKTTIPELVSLYCDYVVPFLFDPYARFKM